MTEVIQKVVVPVTLILALAGLVLTWTRASDNGRLLTETRDAQSRQANLEMPRQLYQQLARDLVVYSQQQPAIDSVLVPMGLKAPRSQNQPQAQTPVAEPRQPTPAPSNSKSGSSSNRK